MANGNVQNQESMFVPCLSSQTLPSEDPQRIPTSELKPNSDAHDGLWISG